MEPVLGKDQERTARASRDDAGHFGRGGDDFHRRDAVERVHRLDPDHRRTAGGRYPRQPGGVGGRPDREVLHVRIVRAPARLVREIVDIVSPRPGGGFEVDLTLELAERSTPHVGDRPAGSGIHHDHGAVFGMAVPPPPWDHDASDRPWTCHVDDRSMVAERLGIPAGVGNDKRNIRAPGRLGSNRSYDDQTNGDKGKPGGWHGLRSDVKA